MADRNQLIKEKVQATKNQQEFDKSKDEQLSKLNENLRELETKVLFQMGANDSSALIDGPAASRLGFHRGLVSNDEAGTLEKFRPYSLPDAAFLARVSEALRARTP